MALSPLMTHRADRVRPAHRCGHCRRLEPTWKQLADELSPSGIAVGRVDATTSQWLAMRFGVSGYPTLIFFANASAMYTYSGARDVASLAAFARGGHETAPASSVPGIGNVLLTVGSQVLKAYAQLFNEVLRHGKRFASGLSPNTVQWGGGLLLLLLCCGAVCCCCVGGRRDAREATHGAHAKQG